MIKQKQLSLEPVKLVQLSSAINATVRADKGKSALVWSETLVSAMDVQGSILEPLWDLAYISQRDHMDQTLDAELKRHKQKGTYKALSHMDLTSSVDVNVQKMVYLQNTQAKEQCQRGLDRLSHLLVQARDNTVLKEQYEQQLSHWYVGLLKQVGVGCAQWITHSALVSVCMGKPLEVDQLNVAMEQKVLGEERSDGGKGVSVTYGDFYWDMSARYERKDEQIVLTKGIYCVQYEEVYTDVLATQLPKPLVSIMRMPEDRALEKLRTYGLQKCAHQVQTAASQWGVRFTHVCVHEDLDDTQMVDAVVQQLQEQQQRHKEQQQLEKVTLKAAQKQGTVRPKGL